MDGLDNTDDGIVEVSLVHFDQHIGRYGDVEWLTSPNDGDVNKIWWKFGTGPDSRRPITERVAASAITKNTWYCNFGRTTGDDCDTVRNVSVSKNSSIRKLVQMHGDEKTFGDSGGPWYVGNSAAGIVHGATLSLWGTRRDVWTKADLFDEAVGVRVLIR